MRYLIGTSDDWLKRPSHRSLIRAVAEAKGSTLFHFDDQDNLIRTLDLTTLIRIHIQAKVYQGMKFQVGGKDVQLEEIPPHLLWNLLHQGLDTMPLVRSIRELIASL